VVISILEKTTNPSQRQLLQDLQQLKNIGISDFSMKQAKEFVGIPTG